MRAAFLEGARAIAVLDVPDRDAENGLLELTVISCGICGSDLHGWRHPEYAMAADTAALPGINGHEVVGLVDGKRRVVVEPNLAGSCGTCVVCRQGRAWFCRNRDSIASWGFSDRMHVKPAGLFDVPAEVSNVVASLTEPLACAVHAFRSSYSAAIRGGTLEGRNVAVVGGGVTGLLAAAAATRLGADSVLVIARYPHQHAAAMRLGATETLQSSEGDLLETARAFAADVVVEAVGGSGETFDLSIRLVQPGGEVLVLGLFDKPRSFDLRRAVSHELRLLFPVTYGTADGRHDFEAALDILASAPEVFASLVSHRYKLDETAAAFATAADKSTGALRVLVEP